MKSQNLAFLRLPALLSLATAAALLVSACGDLRGKLISNALINGSNTQASDNPTPTPPPFTSPTPPSTTNAKVFNKSPVYAANSNIGYNITFDNAKNTYSVNSATANNYDGQLSLVSVMGTTGGFLQNADLTVKTDYLDNAGFHTSTLQRAQADGSGNWFFSSVNDPNHQLGQLMAYYWIMQEGAVENGTLPNSWHVTNKNVSVYSYCYDANGSFSMSGPGLNAFWAGISNNFACMSYVSFFESAYDASVYTHEMGHADIDYATNGQISAGKTDVACSFDKNNSCCPTATGCAAAMNEGQADVHAFFTFGSGKIGEFFLNNTLGLPERNAMLNVGTNLTAQNMFGGTFVDPVTNAAVGNYGQEIHEMGGVWGTAWWYLRQTIGADAAGKIFYASLPLFTGADDFSTALKAVLTADQTLVTNGVFTANHATQINAAFNKFGIK